ncbi:M56 family metallopeptidase [Pedobacter agri]|uniref:M56 family metallopeptidase n=1 Tax=Pedobacter agri TaxID=454586 RepID=UPI0027875A8D|nr:M56 family metallopeptidase [Pedobacter agri]MDQ1140270.1 lipopolysaccharide export system protein LptA [Pedobacter agri]
MEWLTYLLKVSVCTVFFFAVYLLVLKKLTFFKFNRFYLLGFLVCSLIIPALQFEIKREIMVIETREWSEKPQLEKLSDEPFNMMQPLAVEYEPKQATEIDWNMMGFYAYLSITAMLLLVCFCRLFALLKYAKGFKQIDGLKLISKTEGFTNCSFFNYVFIDDQLNESELQVLLRHERVHVQQFHSIDKMLLMLFKVLFWFNPVIYLFDKAVEQNHEYEADEITSSGCGSETYANLLLKLAVAKSDMPLIHNFVKSPIKDRIKMLFNSKSKNMKKLTYLLALPVVFGLVWLFAVEVVYAQSETKKDVFTPDALQNKAPKYHELPLPNVKQTDSYFTSKEYLELKEISELAIGKTLNGIINKDYKSKSTIGYDDGKLFKSQGTTYILPKMYLGQQTLNLLKTGDELKIVVASTGFTRGEKFVYLNPKQVFSGDKLIYQMPEPKVYPFLYEVNSVRFNDGLISSITPSGAKKIFNVISNGYNFKLIVDESQTALAYLNNFKKGDSIRLRFVHEVKTGAKSYLVKDWISISKNVKTFGVQNKRLFYKFYKEDGHQKVAGLKADTSKKTVVPKIMSFTKLNVDKRNNISKMEDAVIKIKSDVLSAEKVEWDTNKNILTAKEATLTTFDGTKMVASLVVFNLNKGNFKAYSENGNFRVDNLDMINYDKTKTPKVEYRADSVKFNKSKSIIYMFGNAKVAYDDVNLSGSKIIYDAGRGLFKATNAIIYHHSKNVKADSIYYDLRTSKAKLFGADLDR